MSCSSVKADSDLAVGSYSSRRPATGSGKGAAGAPRRQFCSLGHGAELRPADFRVDGSKPGQGAKAAIGGRDHAVGADDVDVVSRRWAISIGCSMKLVVVSMTPGARTLSSGILALAQTIHSWA